MASLTSEKNGRKRLEVVCPKDGVRRPLRLGKVTKKQAETVRAHVEQLVSAAITKAALPDDTSAWLASVDGELYEKLAGLGLVKNRVSATLRKYFADYITSRIDLKPRTVINLKQVEGFIVRCFGSDKSMREFEKVDGEQFRLFLVGQGLGDNTIRRHLGRAKQVFIRAVSEGAAKVNPFIGMKCRVLAKPERFHFVDRDTVAAVIEACPDAQWRAIVALARFGGLRCPSEVLELKWEHVNWSANRIKVISPKTSKEEGGASRLIPIFPELVKPLQDVFDEAEPGTVHVITRYREKNTNLGTMFGKIVDRAGVKAWEKPFQNMRSTRETELAEEYPIQVVCQWMGNTPSVALMHYLQVRGDHFDRATKKATQNPTQKATGSHRNGLKSETCEIKNEHEKTPVGRGFQAVSAVFREDQVPPRGFELSPQKTNETDVLEECDAQFDALEYMSRGELVRFIEAAQKQLRRRFL